MVKALLVMFNLNAGQRLIEELDKTDFDVRTAFWAYRLESEEWQLIIASPLVDKCGAGAAYDRIQPILREIPNNLDEPLDRLYLHYIAARKTTDPLVQTIARGVRIEREERPRFFHGGSAEGISLAEAYVYRSI